ncbi:MAG: S-layer homology domain-containing protein [Actinomycetia bacterium]|nr:S-layer homology domain-containing protein [Actinomycetes bacterium]
MDRVRFSAVALLFALPLVFPVAPALADGDTTPPVLTSLSFSSAPLDVRASDATLAVTATATDDLSGVRFIRVHFDPPGSSGGVSTRDIRPPATSSIATFPQYAPGGEWQVTVRVDDNVGNWYQYSTFELEVMGFPTTIEVVSTPTAAPAPPAFSDVAPSHPYYVPINTLASLGIIGGYGDGRFGPDNPVTRRQFAKMVVRTLGIPPGTSTQTPFTDLGTPDKNGDPHKYVAVCVAYGITTGKTPTTFAPYDNMTRAQLITMVARAANLPEPPAGYAPVFGNFSHDHYPWARKAAYAGLLDGLQGMGPTYIFWKSATRGEVCVLLYNLLQR